MVSQKYRWDFIGLSTDDKPTSETSDKVVNGSTYYCSDTSKLYVYCDGTWYERKPLGGGGGGGTSDFNDLSNRPKYNGTDMTGSTNIPEVVTYSDFTGTDGTATGTAGLVPAPATTDVGKFLKADGTWDTAGGGGGITELTSADYNYPTDNPTSIALWLLDEGTYSVNGNGNLISVKMNSGRTDSVFSGLYEISNYTESGQAHKQIEGFYNDNGALFARLEQVAANGTYLVGINLAAPTIAQSTGTSTTQVMSQNATTRMVFDKPATGESTSSRIKIGTASGASNTARNQVSIGIGTTSYCSGDVVIGKNATGGHGQNTISSVAVGADAVAYGNGCVAIGQNAKIDNVNYPYNVAIGAYSKATQKGQMDISTLATTNTYGYNDSQYRLLTGLYDGQSAHDAATVSQGNTLSTSAPTTSTVGVLGQLYTDTTNMHTYQCTAISGDTYTWTQRW